MSTSIVFIDTRVADYQTLIDGLEPGAEFYLIDSGSDGLEQVAARLLGRTGIDAIHIISHGSSGSVLLGSSAIDSAALATHASQLEAIGQSLTEAGDILLYGCNVAAADAGVQFIGSLAQATGADVAASSDLTGAPGLGGNWALEVMTGLVDAQPFQPVAQYDHALYSTTTDSFLEAAVHLAARAYSNEHYANQTKVDEINANIDAWSAPQDWDGPGTPFSTSVGPPEAYANGHVLRYINGNASATIGITILEGKKTLGIAFEGTNPLEPRDLWDDLVDIDSHAARLAEFMDKVDAYVDDPGNGIEQVLVTGHSLGGSIAQNFMGQYGYSDTRYRGATFGSPGTEQSYAIDSSRFINFSHTGDVVPWVGEHGVDVANDAISTVISIADFGRLVIDSFAFFYAGPNAAVAADLLLVLAGNSVEQYVFERIASQVGLSASLVQSELTDALLRPDYVISGSQVILDLQRSGDDPLLWITEHSIYEPASGSSFDISYTASIETYIDYCGPGSPFADAFILLGTSTADQLRPGEVASLYKFVFGDYSALLGAGGNDTLGTLPVVLGNDYEANILVGGDGNDSYYVDHTGDQVIERAGLLSSLDTVYFVRSDSNYYNLPDNVENLILLPDTGIGYVDLELDGTGNALNNFIQGNEASNLIVGHDGDDTLVGGGGGDILDGGNGYDIADYHLLNKAISLSLINHTTTYGLFSTTDDLNSIEGAYTTSKDDYLYGDQFSNYFEDYGGYDEYFGGDGADGVSYTHATTGITVDLLTGFQILGGSDVLSDIEDIYGTDYADIFWGNDEANYFSGGSGVDVFHGEGGIDRFHGDSGADVFLFNSTAITDTYSGVFDTILDYRQGQGTYATYSPYEGDSIDLSQAIGYLYPVLPGAPLASLVRAQQDASGSYSRLYVLDENGAWLTIARLDGIHAGNSLSVKLHPTDANAAPVEIAVSGVVDDGSFAAFEFPMGNLDGAGHRTATPANDGDGYYDANNFGDFTDNASENDYHLGEDWNYESGGSTDLGESVYAAAAGTVVFAGDGGTGWGNVVIVKHLLANGAYGGFVTTLYGHLGELSVALGDAVQKGIQLGVIGQVDGLSPHLHFEVRAGTNPEADQVGHGYSPTPAPAGWLDPTDFITGHRGEVAQANWTITPATTSINEADTSISFTITRSSATTAQTVYLSTTVNHGSLNQGDYGHLYNQAITFAAGDPDYTATIQINEDSEAEGSETFGFIVQDDPAKPASSFLVSAQFTINDDDTYVDPGVGESWTGTSASESYGGTAGHDYLNGNGGNDDLFGYGGNDNLTGGGGNDSLSGGSGDDSLTDGNGGSDTLRGGAGKDYLQVQGAGTDIIDGGTGIDTLSLNRSDLTGNVTIAVVSDGNGSTYDFSLPDGTTVSGIELLSLTTGSGDDHVTFANTTTLGSQHWTAGAGNDKAVVDFSGFSTAVTGQGWNGGADTNYYIGSQSTGYWAWAYHVYLETVEDLTLYGGSGNDSFNRSSGNNVLVGNDGNDYLDGGSGNDSLDGGVGDDSVIDGNGGSDTLRGGAGKDYLQVQGAGTDIIDGGTGIDTLSLNRSDLTGNVTIAVVSDGNGSTYDFSLPDGTTVSGIELLSLTTGSGDDHVTFANTTTLGSQHWTAGAGNDKAVVDFSGFSTAVTGQGWNGGADTNYYIGSQSTGYWAWAYHVYLETVEDLTLYGGSGNDSFNRSSGNNVLVGNDGNDYLDGGSGNDSLDGGVGDDSLDDSSGGNDTLRGGTGNDYFSVSGTSADVIDGGTGVDTLYLYRSDLLAAVTVALVSDGTGSTNDFGLPDGTTVSGIELLNLTTGSGNDHVTFANTTTLGSQSWTAGAGTDTAVVDFSGFSTAVTGQGWNGGADTNYYIGSQSTGYWAWAYHVYLETVEDLTLYGGSGNDSFNRSSGNNVLVGNDGNDYLDGGSGNDSLDGGVGDDSLDDSSGGNDTLRGGTGNDYFSVSGTSADVIDGGTGVDTLYLYRSDLLAAVTVALVSDGTGSTNDFGLPDGTTVSGIELLNLTTGSGNDHVTFANTTTLGSQSWTAGAGTDTAVVDFSGFSTAVDGQGWRGSDAPYVVGSQSNGSWSWNYQILLDGVENLTLSGGSGNDSFRRSAGNNVLIGNDGNDNLYGGSGNDSLDGGAGNDNLTGGAGNDVFIYASAANGNDFITDFSAGDIIRIVGAQFTSGAVSAGDGANLAANQVQVASSAGISSLSIGTDGVTGAEIVLQLNGTFSAAELRASGSDIWLNRAPILTGIATTLASGAEDLAYTVSGASLLTGFTDADGDTLSVIALTANHGTVADNGNGTWTITPAANYNGPVGLDYSVSDGHGGTVAASQSFTLAAVNDAPALTGMPATLAAGTEDVAYIVSTADLLAGFSDADGDILSISGLMTMQGSAVDNGNGTWIITRAANANGPVNLSYTVVDGNGGSLSANQSFAVAAVNDAPTISAGGGMVVAAFDAAPAWAQSIGVQLDGQVLLAGGVYDSQTDNVDFALVRYTADGSLDASFGVDGRVATGIRSGSEWATDAAIQQDGKIVVTGYGYEANAYDAEIVVVRYNGDGSLDTGFSSDGKLTTDLAGSYQDIANSIAVQGDGKILVAGERGLGVGNTGNFDFALLRYNPDGSLDAGFGGGGIAISDFAGGNDSAQDLVVLDDGKILVAGTADAAGLADFALARYNADGSLDTGFSGDGTLTTDIAAGYDYGSALAVQADGKILLAGTTRHSDIQFAIARYGADGSLDTGFGGDGMVTTLLHSAYSASVDGIVVQSDGKILVSGFSLYYANPASERVLVRYNPDGSLDTGFGSAGMLVTDAGSHVAVQPDGKILVAGADGFALARYSSDGVLDASFGVPAYVEGGTPVRLDATARAYDPELSAAGGALGLYGTTGNYAGASLTLVRQGGADAHDEFSTGGNLGPLTPGGALVLSGTTIGVVSTNAGGSLTLAFSDEATQARVDEVLSSIRYANTSDAPAASVQIDWIFSDGNSGSQGTGGTLAATGSTTVNIININDAPTGAVTIEGVAAQNETLAASNSLADADGLGEIHRQWQASGDAGGGWSDIAWATGATFVPTINQVGKYLRVLVSYTDGQGTAESIPSAPTALVTLPSGDDSLVGGEGNDTLIGLGGNDTLAGLDGNDSLDGGSGADSISGGAGADTLLGGIGDDSMNGGLGSDYLDGGSGNDTLWGGDYSSGDADTLIGGAGNDTLYGTEGNAVLEGGDGDDYIGGRYLRVLGGAGNDTIDVPCMVAFVGLNLAELIDGGDGYDIAAMAGYSQTPTGSNLVPVVNALRNIEEVRFNDSSWGYSLTLTGQEVAAGQTVKFWEVPGWNGSTGVLNLDGSAVTDGNLWMIGGTSAETLIGGGGQDTLSGSGGDDVLRGNAGDDLIDGGVGSDTAIFSGNYASYTITEGVGELTIAGPDGTDTLRNVNALQFNDQTILIQVPGLVYNGTESIDSLVGGEGNDTLIGLGGNDTLVGLDGNDSLDGGSGADSISGGAGADTLLGGIGDDSMNGGLGSDYLDGGSGSDTLWGGDYSSGDADTLIGGAGNDTLYGTEGNAVLEGGDGDDYIGGRYLRVLGGAGNDTIDVPCMVAFVGLNLAELIDGGDGYDIAAMAGYSQTPTGSNLVPVVNALRNIEEVRFNDSSWGYSLTLTGQEVAAGQTVKFWEVPGWNGSTGVLNLDGSAVTDGNLWMIGGTSAETLIGGGGQDTLSGSGGDDVLRGNAGDDLIDGGVGSDTAIFSGNYASYTITEGVGELTIAGPDGTDTLRNINVLQFNDQIIGLVTPGLYIVGTEANDAIDGNDGSDLISGLGGDDSISAAGGNDSVDGGLGNDTLLGGSGNDTILGGSGNDQVDAGDGNDEIVGGDGAGDDTYVGGLGVDTVRYTSAITGITVNLLTGSASGNEIGIDVLAGIENIIGGQAGDTLIGGSSANAINGYIGNDTLTGALGNDSLDGGLGQDTATFSGQKAGYTVTRLGAGYTVTDSNAGDGDEGTDSLTGIEKLQFSDQMMVLGAKATDVDSDGKSDLLIRNADGATLLWQMNGTTTTSSATLLGPGSWSIANGHGDYNGDGKSDLLVQNSNGDTRLWLMNGSAITSSTILLGPGNWRVIDGQGDYDGDGKSDLLVRNSNGDTRMWLMNGTTTSSSSTLLGAGNWSVVEGHGDYNGDGKSDLIVRNADGTTLMWLMNGGVVSGSATLLGPGSWSVISGNGDYNGDGKSDLLVRNANGDTRMWLMNGTTTTSSSVLLGPGSWNVIDGQGDYNGDGKSDLLVRNSNGDTRMWLMDGTTTSSSAVLLGPGSWGVADGHSDTNGDGKSDLVVQNSNGDTRLWLMNGTTTSSSTVLLGPGAWSTWQTEQGGVVSGDTGANSLTGTTGNDQLYGNAGSDSLAGGAGNDSLDGGADSDTAVFSGLKATYSIAKAGTGWTVSGGGEGTDTLSGIEKLQFADGTVTLGARISDPGGDGKSDLLVRNADGATLLWQMNGTTTTSSATLLGPGSWSIVNGHGDYNGDGKSDLLVQNSNGDTRLWLMNGSAITSSTILLGPGNWRVIDGQGDYDGDGKSDLLVRNSNGDTRMWLMNGTTTSSSSTLLGAGNWSVVEGHGDYNGDGKSDLIVRNADGTTLMWLMNGGVVSGSATLLGPGSWSVISGHGDYNGDGKSDLLVRNANGDTRMWLMNGTTTTSSSVLLGPGSWNVIDGQGDYNGDGKSDLLVRNSNGDTRMWLMDGTTTSSSSVLLGPGSWGVADGHSDTNGDGKSDLVVQNSNGDTRLWLMNGTTTSSSTVLLGPGTWSTWQTEQGGGVTGDAGANSLTGTTGNDQLYGNAGNDSLSGGGGNDQFVFNTALNAGTNVDTITDFSRGADQVLLDHLIFTALGVGNLAAGSFVAEAGAIAHDGNDYVLYDTTTGNLSYDPDGTGAGAATLFANLATHPAIVAGDLAVV